MMSIPKKHPRGSHMMPGGMVMPNAAMPAKAAKRRTKKKTAARKK